MIPTLVGVPWDASSSFERGAALAPPRIRAALASAAGNAWTEDLSDLSGTGMFDDAGDLAFAPDESAEAARAAIEEKIGALLEAGRRPLVLGGDHAITWPVVRALRPRHRRLSILHVDAHPDLYDEFEGDRGSHACPFARIMEGRLADQLVQVGIRAMTGHQAEQAARFGVETIDMRAVAAGQRPTLQHPVYVSIDLDALDPAFAPGVSHREPGGLTTRELLSLVQNIQVPIVGADIVEYNPVRDAADLTASVAAKLVKEMISVMHRSG
ncbi:MAG TPA: agmatinase [Gemmatimonadaceae bacterium]|nr:agmatinase [Gemmatimonadaceae bacterium]